MKPQNKYAPQVPRAKRSHLGSRGHRGDLGPSWESLVERRIQEAYAAGDFDNLPGFGRPIPELDYDDDELWWVKSLLRREQLSIVPPSLEILRVAERELERIKRLACEDDVRRAVRALNEQIRKANFAIVSGPPSTIGPLDVERVLGEWQKERADAGKRN